MLWIEIDQFSTLSITQQIFVKIRDKILLGELQEGERLPSSRELAETLGVSRGIILEVYDQLMAEGYLKSKKGAGTFVESGILLKDFPLLKGFNEEKPCDPTVKANKPNEDNYIDFRSGIPALNMFPRHQWARIAKEVYENMDESLLGYHFPEGSEELRSTLSKYLYRTRGIKCHSNQIVITSGATQALTILAKLLLDSEKEVMIEDPVTKEIREIFMERGAAIIPIPVDDDGMKTECLTPDRKPSFVFVTPSHQFPLGGTLPIQRRIQLINFAIQTNCYIVEDDYDSEFRYTGPPISSIQGLQPDRVIYIGTFSKILSPGLRIGYLILPEILVEKVKTLKRYIDYHSPTTEQVILARFIQEGYLEKHITKMRKVYKNNREIFIHCLKEEFGDRIKVTGFSTGLHLIAQFENITFSNDVLTCIKKNKVKVYPVEDHAFVKGHHNDKLIFGYGYLKPSEMQEGIKRLKKGLASAFS